MSKSLPDLKRLNLITDRPEALAVLESLRKSLSPRGDIVSPRGRELTMKVFGEALAPLPWSTEFSPT